MRVRLSSVTLLVSLIVGCSTAENTAVVQGKNLANPNLRFGMPRNRAQHAEKIIERQQYVLSWNPERRVANWVAWKIELSDLGDSGRDPSYYVDRDLSEMLRGSGISAVSPTEFEHSCFDRGHQVPSADRTSNDANNRVTFFMSNMYPQTAFLNKGMWEQLESASRKLVRTQKKLYVIAGGTFDKNTTYLGPKRNIAVPATNFKIVAITDPAGLKPNEFIFVNMPNVMSDGRRPKPYDPSLCAEMNSSHFSSEAFENDAWKKYQTSLEKIERDSGFNFLPELSVAQRKPVATF